MQKTIVYYRYLIVSRSKPGLVIIKLKIPILKFMHNITKLPQIKNLRRPRLKFNNTIFLTQAKTKRLNCQS